MDLLSNGRPYHRHHRNTHPTPAPARRPFRLYFWLASRLFGWTWFDRGGSHSRLLADTPKGPETWRPLSYKWNLPGMELAGHCRNSVRLLFCVGRPDNSLIPSALRLRVVCRFRSLFRHTFCFDEDVSAGPGV